MKKKKQISERERQRRLRQSEGPTLYTPEGPIKTEKVKGGYKLIN